METLDRNGPRNGIAHYRYLVARHGLFLAMATPIAMVVVLVVVFALPQKDPDLTARALIGIENREDMGADRQKSKENLGREDLMLGRTFIKDVVSALSLQVVTGDKRRSVFFDSAAVDSTTPLGLYRVRVNKGAGNFSIEYFDTNTFKFPLFGILPYVKGRTLFNGRSLSPGPIAVTGGVHLVFTKKFLSNPRSFDFAVINIRMAVENVLRGLTIKRADPEHGINYITVQMTGKDYELLAVTANEIARLFVEKNLSFSKQRSLSVLAALEKQLAFANNGQGSTGSALSSFQTENPQIVSSSRAAQSAGSLAQINAAISTAQRTLAETEGLKTAFAGAQGDDKTRIASAMLETMSQNNIAAARPLRESLQQLIVEQRDFAVNYDERHPLREENTRRIAEAVRAAAALFASFSDNLRGSLASQTATRSAVTRELNQLPEQQMQLGRLQRKQQVINQVYAAVLERYNQAKIADAVEVADFYLMDAAVPPLPPPQDRSQGLLIALLIGLVLPLGFQIVRDRVTGTVYTKNALSDTFDLPVLEAIPEFKSPPIDGNKNRTPRIDNGCRPAFIPELFDSLLMKLRLRWGENIRANVVAITGLETGGGKSTIAINFAIRLAEQGDSVLLVDTDMHRGKIHDQFNFPLSPGLSEALKVQEESIISGPFSLTHKTEVPGLSIIPAGEEINNSFSALSSARFADLVAHWRKHFTYVIIDAAPIGVIPDAAAFSALVDSYIIVVDAGSTNSRALRDRLDEYTHVKSKVAGFVLNRSNAREALLYHRSYSRYHRNKDA